jgi:hypothetical protein
MRTLHRHVRHALILCVVALPAIAVALLALTDIYHQEEDLTLEWIVLRVSFLIILAAVLASLLVLRRIIQMMTLTELESPHDSGR